MQFTPNRSERRFLEYTPDPTLTQRWIDEKYAAIQALVVAGVRLPSKPPNWQGIESVYRDVQRQIDSIYRPTFYAIGIVMP